MLDYQEFSPRKHFEEVHIGLKTPGASCVLFYYN